MDLHLTKVFITIELTSNVADCLLLFRLRNQFKEAFKKIVRCSGSQCRTCCNSTDCPYLFAFSQLLSNDPSAVKRFQKPPLPFIFDMQVLPEPPNRGAVCEIGLVLVGQAVNHVPSYISSFELMLRTAGSEGQPLGRIIRTETAGYHGERYPFRQSKEGAVSEEVLILSAQGVQQASTLSPTEVNLSLVTPLRLMREGRLVRELSSPSLLLKAALRRISSIVYYYGEGELQSDFKYLARLSDRAGWQQADFTWRKWSDAVSGITGSGVLVGDLTEFHRFLLLAEYVHLGKGASSGMGKLHLGNGR